MDASVEPGVSGENGEGEGPAGGPLARTAQPRGAGGFPPVGRGVAPNQLYLSHIATIIARVRPPPRKEKLAKWISRSSLTEPRWFSEARSFS